MENVVHQPFYQARNNLLNRGTNRGGRRQPLSAGEGARR
uniref:ADP,ATP carrier protein n=1 Tax=Arundo donax TaxID=35708 RepID=A0A0A9ART1_ARUDO